MKFEMSTKFVTGVNNKEKGVVCSIEGPKGKKDIDADVCLLSIGRRPYTGGLQLEKAGLTLNQRGQVDINK